MKKRILLLSAVLSLTVLLGGCSLLPFAEDNPFEKQEVKEETPSEDEKTGGTAHSHSCAGGLSDGRTPGRTAAGRGADGT